MNGYRLLFGLLLVAIAIPLAALQPAAVPSQTATAPQQCQPTPDRPVAGGDDGAISGTVAQATENQSIVEITYTVREQPSDTLEIELPPGATLVNQSGFDSADGQYLYAWVQRGDQLTLRYLLTKRGRGGATSFKNMSYVAGADWMIAPTPAHSGADTGLQPADSGVIGTNILYLGNYTTQTREADCQNITLVVPAAADLNPEPKLKSLARAARSFSVGNPYSTVRYFVSPQPITAAAGFTPQSENNVLIEDDLQVHSAWNAWVHEYIHTRQTGEAVGQNFTWFQEASATYYAARLSLEQGLISPAAYDAALAQNAQYDPSTDLATANADEVAYRWGAVVLARLDTALVQRGHTLAGVFDAVNRESTTYADFESQLAQRGLNDSQLNKTRATVLDDDRPDPALAYTSPWQWLPRPLLAQWSLLSMVPTFLLGVIGSILVGDELLTWLSGIRGAGHDDDSEADATADDD
ncbi:hypothetical protein SAMN05216388_103818 [Halorientalis persicus]|uniref:Peptidase MA superfamily protein n=1 Tax=Halorientalis persicus TaxID=1367881 RepID=A0A1H8VK56_9EURY|nr:hypothetical protein [Halorientalis persicus]SEP15288.1 hypothetical protein SAMN05216388_103818 [Halorientalis persicus]